MTAWSMLARFAGPGRAMPGLVSIIWSDERLCPGRPLRHSSSYQIACIVPNKDCGAVVFVRCLSARAGSRSCRRVVCSDRRFDLGGPPWPTFARLGSRRGALQIVWEVIEPYRSSGLRKVGNVSKLGYNPLPCRRICVQCILCSATRPIANKGAVLRCDFRSCEQHAAVTHSNGTGSEGGRSSQYG